MQCYKKQKKTETLVCYVADSRQTHLMPVWVVTDCDERWPFSTSNTITFDQSWRHLHSNSAGGKGLSNDFQTRLIRSMVQWVKSSRRVSFDYIWLIHVKNCPSWWFFLGKFCIESKPSRGSITAAKRWVKKKKEGDKNLKAKRHRPCGKFYFCACRARREKR